MKIHAYKFLWIFSCVILPSHNAFSQSNSISDYVPPPLFGGAPTIEPPLKIENNNSEVKKERPAPSKVIELRHNENNAPTKQEANNLKKLKELRALKAARSNVAPVPKKKPARNAAVVSKKTEEKIIPNYQGVVKGPKTMPAVKKKTVEAEVLGGETNSPVQTDMLARVQKKVVPIKEPSVQPAKETEKTKDNAVSVSLLKDRLVLVFETGETTLSESKMAMLLDQVAPTVKGNEKRLNITAYASPDAEALNADKRIALSRGLAVRGYLLKNGVKPNQINVRSLGSDTPQQPYDRVEIVLIQ